MINPLHSRSGRLRTLFLLYVTEGIPLGFAATAIATEMRRRGLGPAAIGGFVAALYLPWAWKWAIGPVVDVIASERWGRRRGWILATQLAMVATLLTAMTLDVSTQLGLFTAVIVVHNLFGATQDVAIDALACHVLPPEERGVANGLMFGGAYLGQTIGGAGVLFARDQLNQPLGPVLAWQASFVLVSLVILGITALVVWPLREPAYPPRPPIVGPALLHIAKEISKFLRDTWHAFADSRPAKVGVLYALLPAGAMSLSMSLASNLTVELGLADGEIANLNLWGTVIAASCCILGGYISDRLGRRRMLTLYLLLTIAPTLWLAWQLRRYGWELPIAPDAPGRPSVPPQLPAALWIASLLYAVPQGLAYGTRTALFMDVTRPAVAATQFTAYMALMNVSISYTARWQGWAAERWGYPVTMAIDAAAALIGLPLLLWMVQPRAELEPAESPQAPEHLAS